MADASQHTLLLNSGYRMPIIGLGTWQTDQQDLVDIALETAIKAGYRHIDTAFNYQNEVFLGKSLQKLFKNGLIKREDLFIVTKLPSNGMRYEAVKHFFVKSLTNLQLEYIDLYLVHTPIAAQRTDDDNAFMPFKDGKFLADDEINLNETWQAMEELVEDGMVRSIGLSNFNSEQIQSIYDASKIKPANLQVECHAYLQQHELQEFCKKLDIAFTAYSPLGSPGLADFVQKTFKIEMKQEKLLDDPKLKPLCEKYNKTQAQILLRYLVQRNMAVIPKSFTPERIKENIQIFDFNLSQDDMEVLKSMNKNLRYFKFDYGGVADHPEYPFNIPY